MNIKYSQDIDKVINNDFYLNIIFVFQTCVSKEGQFSSFPLQHNCFQLRSHKKDFQGFSTPPLVF